MSEPLKRESNIIAAHTVNVGYVSGRISQAYTREGLCPGLSRADDLVTKRFRRAPNLNVLNVMAKLRGYLPQSSPTTHTMRSMTLGKYLVCFLVARLAQAVVLLKI